MEPSTMPPYLATASAVSFMSPVTTQTITPARKSSSQDSRTPSVEGQGYECRV